MTDQTHRSSTYRDGVCNCEIKFHTERRLDGSVIAVLDEELPDILDLCFSKCPKCNLPYHLEFRDDPSRMA